MPPKRRRLDEPKRDRWEGLPHRPSSVPFLFSLSQNGRACDARTAAGELYAGGAHRRVLPTLRQREFAEPDADKVFAAHWLDPSHVLVGTKDNKLLKLCVDPGAPPGATLIPRPPAPPRSFSTTNPGWGSCGIHCIDVSPSGDLLATGGADTADAVVLRTADWSPVTTLMGHRDWLFGAAWVTDRHLVTGSRDSTVALWGVDPGGGGGGGGHEVQERNFADGRAMKRKFGGASKVREVKYDADLGLVAALGTEGVVKLMDPAADLRAARSLLVSHPRELVCMALRRDLVAVGGLSHVSLSDPRKRDPGAHVAELLSPDAMQGVRSVGIAGDVLSFGTGLGKIAFYDLRAGKFLPTAFEPWEGCPLDRLATTTVARRPGPLDSDADTPTPNPNPNGNPALTPTIAPMYNPFDRIGRPWRPLELGAPEDGEGEPPAAVPSQHLQTGPGWVEENSTFYDFFGGRIVRHACYAHAWDASGTRLFAAGGPLAFGLTGGYMALWE